MTTGSLINSAWVTSTDAGVPAGTGTGSITLSEPTVALTPGNYAWKVVCRYGASPGTPSPYSFFSIGTPSPVQVSPINWGNTAASSPSFSFTALLGATDYQILLYSFSTGVTTTTAWIPAADCGVPTGVGTGTFILPAPIAPGSYAWRITARFGTIIGTQSAYQYLNAL